MPTIRIDEEVYKWLQDQASPFEDTPNSVLRRLAGFEKKLKTQIGDSASQKGEVIGDSRKVQTMPPRRQSGKRLNEKWNVRAKHALYHREGHWYNNLERFPGALFDPHGYVLFKTEDAYRNCRYLRITKETNVLKGISSIPEYIKVE